MDSTLWLVDLFLKATLVLTGAMIAVLVLKHSSAAARHSLWTVALAMLIGIPLLGVAVPRWQFSLLPRFASLPFSINLDEVAPRTTTVIASSSSAVVIPPERIDGSGSVVAEGNFHPHEADAVAALRPERTPEGVGTRNRWMNPWILIVWGMGCLAALAPLLRGILILADMKRRSVPIDDTESLELLAKLATRLGLNRKVILLEARQAMIPMTSGLLRPTIMVPGDWHAWSEERKSMVILHELAHVKRHDAAYQILSRVSCAFYWFHPLVWYAIRQQRAESELACDDRVLSTGMKASSYATELLEIARTMQTAVVPCAVAMATRNGLENRVRAILGTEISRAPLSSRAFLSTVAAGLGTTLALSTMQFDVLAQNGSDFPGDEPSPQEVTHDSAQLPYSRNVVQQAVSETRRQIRKGIHVQYTVTNRKAKPTTQWAGILGGSSDGTHLNPSWHAEHAVSGFNEFHRYGGGLGIDYGDHDRLFVYAKKRYFSYLPSTKIANAYRRSLHAENALPLDAAPPEEYYFELLGLRSRSGGSARRLPLTLGGSEETAPFDLLDVLGDPSYVLTDSEDANGRERVVVEKAGADRIILDPDRGFVVVSRHRNWPFSRAPRIELQNSNFKKLADGYWLPQESVIKHFPPPEHAQVGQVAVISNLKTRLLTRQPDQSLFKLDANEVIQIMDLTFQSGKIDGKVDVDTIIVDQNLVDVYTELLGVGER